MLIIKDVFKKSKKNTMNALISKNNEDTYIFLNIAQNEYMISTKFVREILELPHLELPQKLPRHVLGLLEYNNVLVNVLDLRSVFNLEREKYNVKSKLIVLEFEGFPFAVVVDKVLNIQKLDKSLLKDAPYETRGEIIKKIYSRLDNSSVLVISSKELAAMLKTVLSNAEFDNSGYNLLPSDGNSLTILNKRAIDIKNKKAIKIYSILDDVNQFISFKIKDELYSIKNAYIKGFYKFSKMKVTKIPNTPEFVLGLLNFRGDYVCVIDLKRFFNRGNTDTTDKTTVVIVDANDFKFAFLVDEIGQVLDIDEQIFEKNKDDELIEYVENNLVFSILNIGAIIKNKRLIIE